MSKAFNTKFWFINVNSATLAFSVKMKYITKVRFSMYQFSAKIKLTTHWKIKNAYSYMPEYFCIKSSKWECKIFNNEIIQAVLSNRKIIRSLLNWFYNMTSKTYVDQFWTDYRR